jgi:transcriptional regulator with XRE-family HTH domain
MLGMSNNVVRKVGHRSGELRQKEGWSREKLAEEARLHRTYVGQVERGEKSIGVENLFRIASVPGLTASTPEESWRPRIGGSRQSGIGLRDDFDSLPTNVQLKRIDAALEAIGRATAKEG